MTKEKMAKVVVFVPQEVKDKLEALKLASSQIGFGK
jgi:hypothetical protein